MQTAIALEQGSFEEDERRPVTYQLVMCGKDGALIASDTREYRAPGREDHGHGVSANMVSKIRLDPAGQYAWAYAGGEVAPVAASYLAQAFQAGRRPFSDLELENELRVCGDRAWSAIASSPNPHSTIILLHGPSRKIMRTTLSPGTVTDMMRGGLCFAGQTFSLASLFPTRFYSGQMSVSELAALASYTVTLAGELDPPLIQGLDVAVYRDSSRKFEFLDGDACSQLARNFAANVDASVRESISRLSSQIWV